MAYKSTKINQGNFIPQGTDPVERYGTPVKFFNDLVDDFQGVVNSVGDIIGNLIIDSQGTPTAKTTAVTLTAAEILAEIITGTHTAGATQAYTLPTGTQLETALNGRVGVDQSFTVAIINLSAAGTDTITLTAGAGFTIVGNPIILNAASSEWRVRKTALNTFVAYRIS